MQPPCVFEEEFYADYHAESMSYGNLQSHMDVFDNDDTVESVLELHKPDHIKGT